VQVKGMITDLGDHAFCVVEQNHRQFSAEMVDRLDRAGREFTVRDVTSGSFP